MVDKVGERARADASPKTHSVCARKRRQFPYWPGNTLGGWTPKTLESEINTVKARNKQSLFEAHNVL
jgi:hypothetical protein